MLSGDDGCSGHVAPASAQVLPALPQYAVHAKLDTEIRGMLHFLIGCSSYDLDLLLWNLQDELVVYLEQNPPCVRVDDPLAEAEPKPRTPPRWPHSPAACRSGPRPAGRLPPARRLIRTSRCWPANEACPPRVSDAEGLVLAYERGSPSRSRLTVLDGDQGPERSGARSSATRSRAAGAASHRGPPGRQTLCSPPGEGARPTGGHAAASAANRRATP
jgi:hypothetical protein